MSEPSAHAPEPLLWTAPPRGRVLCFAPHPDDEIVGPGGALCLHARAGDPVRVVVATDGISGDPDGRFDKPTFGARRRDESRAGLREIGVDDVGFWGFPDGCVLSDHDMALGTRKAGEELAAFRPDVVYLPWEREGHSDHHALHLLVLRALQAAAFGGQAYGYEIWNAMVPDVILDITSVAETKRRALLCHRSQIDYVAYDHVIMGLNAYRSLVHGHGRGYGEGFRHITVPMAT